MVDFICMGLLDLKGARTENYKMQNSCQSGIRTRNLPHTKQTRSVLRLILCENDSFWLKILKVDLCHTQSPVSNNI